MGMFGKKKQEPGPAPSAVKSSSNPHQITTLIGEECFFEGSLSSSSSTRIDGTLKGKVSGENTLIVGERGKVIGEIKAVETVVYGRVEGVIESNKLEIKKSGVVSGDVIIDIFIVEDGGIYNGSCSMNEPSGHMRFETEIREEAEHLTEQEDNE